MAMYFKIHHALVDGVAGIRIARRALSENPDECGMLPFWACRGTRRTRTASSGRAMRAAAATRLARGAQAQLAGAQALVRMALR
jgi:diacylglycerol O-acyltransferase